MIEILGYSDWTCLLASCKNRVHVRQWEPTWQIVEGPPWLQRHCAFLQGEYFVMERANVEIRDHGSESL